MAAVASRGYLRRIVRSAIARLVLEVGPEREDQMETVAYVLGTLLFLGALLYSLMRVFNAGDSATARDQDVARSAPVDVQEETRKAA
jgi:hypothetical protein